MQRKQLGSAAAGLLLAAAVFGVAGYAAGTQQGVITNGRFVADPMPGWPDPGAQRQEMIAALKSIDKKVGELDARLLSMKTVLDAVERHERGTYLLLGSQKEASPNEKKE